MKFEEHCLDSEVIFGKKFEEVHKWLDEFAGKPNIGMKHRKFRHHLKGIEEVEKLFGLEASKAARRHIEQDMKEEGWTVKDHFPINENDYTKMGLY